MTRMLVTLGCVAFLASLGPAAQAHYATSGWAYDPACCAGHDCHEITDDAVSLVPGGWKIKATGEVILQSTVKHSPDGRFHRCSAQGKDDGKTYCLYVPDFGM